MNMEEFVDTKARIERAIGLMAYIDKLKAARQVFAGDKDVWDVKHIRVSTLPKLRELAVFDIEAQIAIAQKEYAEL